MDLQAFFKLSYGLYVLSAAENGKSNGCIVNTVMQVTAEPPKLAVAVHKQNLTAEMIERTGFFNAVALTESADLELIGQFGFASGRENEKYHNLPFAHDENGLPYLTEHTAALVSAKVTGQMDLGTHLLFVGEATGAQILSDAPVMTYSYYHQVKKGITPPKAASYQPMAEKAGWRCKICGYIHEGETLPADYICPICKKDASFFVKL